MYWTEPVLFAEIEYRRERALAGRRPRSPRTRVRHPSSRLRRTLALMHRPVAGH